ncbi:interferon alpha-inducible protein 27, mitochondrial-like [Lepisosteus oculatus]|uniref:interferon alpha-inducible protein 27, mitochondrial-like n=1 Tax=Lepisosteus oculatus TaxID=7918 RepID=UPI00371833F3
MLKRTLAHFLVALVCTGAFTAGRGGRTAAAPAGRDREVDEAVAFILRSLGATDSKTAEAYRERVEAIVHALLSYKDCSCFWSRLGIAVAGGATAVVLTPAVLAAIGFTSSGIVAGSLAAKMMSLAALANGGGVAAGSLVAFLQSLGTGLGAAAVAAVGSAGASVSYWVSSIFMGDPQAGEL